MTAVGDPIVLLGDSSTDAGKYYLLIGLGVATCEQGRRVRYATAAQFVNELAEAADERRLSRIVGYYYYGRLDLRTPTDKPRAERTVPFVRNSFLAGETFIDLADAQRRAVQW